ncbi:MAG: hypothetical protein FJ243_00395 [Nitrospira sp.]|nr:hypothetical protein [Nitrospira sp.]
MEITRERLNFAGWLSIASAILTIVYLARIQNAMESSRDIKTVMTIISMVLFCYLFSTLRKLLNLRFSFHEVDFYISVLIWGYVVICFLSIYSFGAGEGETALTNFLTVTSIVFEIFIIIFSIKMLRFPGNLYGLLKPFCYTMIAAGICLISLILIPLGLIASAAADIILGMIFFRAAGQSSSFG